MQLHRSRALGSKRVLHLTDRKLQRICISHTACVLGLATLVLGRDFIQVSGTPKDVSSSVPSASALKYLSCCHTVPNKAAIVSRCSFVCLTLLGGPSWQNSMLHNGGKRGRRLLVAPGYATHHLRLFHTSAMFRFGGKPALRVPGLE